MLFLGTEQMSALKGWMPVGLHNPQVGSGDFGADRSMKKSGDGNHELVGLGY